MPEAQATKPAAAKRPRSHAASDSPAARTAASSCCWSSRSSTSANQGDVVEVKPGYALNYLLPQGLATFATDHHKRMVEKHKARLLEIQKARLAEPAGHGRRDRAARA